MIGAEQPVKLGLINFLLHVGDDLLAALARDTLELLQVFSYEVTFFAELLGAGIISELLAAIHEAVSARVRKFLAEFFESRLFGVGEATQFLRHIQGSVGNEADDLVLAARAFLVGSDEVCAARQLREVVGIAETVDLLHLAKALG